MGLRGEGVGEGKAGAKAPVRSRSTGDGGDWAQ